mgnify:CR=1 FL=1
MQAAPPERYHCVVGVAGVPCGVASAVLITYSFITMLAGTVMFIVVSKFPE